MARRDAPVVWISGRCGPDKPGRAGTQDGRDHVRGAGRSARPQAVHAPRVPGVIEQHRDHGKLVLVGHNPTMSELATILAYGIGCSGLGLKTGSAAMIELKGGTEPGIASLEDVIRLDD